MNKKVQSSIVLLIAPNWKLFKGHKQENGSKLLAMELTANTGIIWMDLYITPNEIRWMQRVCGM